MFLINPPGVERIAINFLFNRKRNQGLGIMTYMAYLKKCKQTVLNRALLYKKWDFQILLKKKNGRSGKIERAFCSDSSLPRQFVTILLGGNWALQPCCLSSPGLLLLVSPP